MSRFCLSTSFQKLPNPKAACTVGNLRIKQLSGPVSIYKLSKNIILVLGLFCSHFPLIQILLCSNLYNNLSKDTPLIQVLFCSYFSLILLLFNKFSKIFLLFCFYFSLILPIFSCYLTGCQIISLLFRIQDLFCCHVSLILYCAY